MLPKRLMLVVGLLAAFSMILSACAPNATATTAPPVPTTAGPAATEAPTAVPQTTRHGGWLDEIDFSVVASDSAISQVQAGAVDLYSYGLASSDFPAIKSLGLKYDPAYGSSYSLQLNSSTPKDATKLNPFTDAKIREAMNWAIDRNYIAQEIAGGLAIPRYTAVDDVSPDGARYAADLASIVTKYGYNLAGESVDAYVAMYTIKDALERAASTDPAKIRAALAATKLSSGPAMIAAYDKIEFDSTGQNKNAALVIVQVNDQGNGLERFTVWPKISRHAGYKPVFPMP